MDAASKNHQCPYCGVGMRPVAMACARCHVEVRGQFQDSRLARCNAEDIAFLERYLLAGFSIKALAEESGLGYAAIRTRLDRLIESFRQLHEADRARHAVLERLELGEIDAAQAAIELGRI